LQTKQYVYFPFSLLPCNNEQALIIPP